MIAVQVNEELLGSSEYFADPQHLREAGAFFKFDQRRVVLGPGALDTDSAPGWSLIGGCDGEGGWGRRRSRRSRGLPAALSDGPRTEPPAHGGRKVACRGAEVRVITPDLDNRR